MKKFIFGIMLLVINYSSVYATTAILCGDANKVDQNNNLASVWLIFDNEDSRSSAEVQALFKGHESKILDINEQSGKIYISFVKPEWILVLDKNNIESSSCDGESLFSLKLNLKSTSKTIKNCRCFAD